MTAEQCSVCKYDHPERPDPTRRCVWPSNRNDNWCERYATKRGFRRVQRPDGQVPPVSIVPQEPAPREVAPTGAQQDDRFRLGLRLPKRLRSKLAHIKTTRQNRGLSQSRYSYDAIMTEALDRLPEEGE